MASDTIDMQNWLPCYAANLPHCPVYGMATDTVCSHSICHKEYTTQVAIGTLDVHISCRPVQLAPETALTTDCGNYHSVVTITNHSEKLDATMKKHVSGYYHSNSANSVATWKSVCVATITVIQ